MKTGRKTIILIIVSQFSSFLTDHPSSLISREDSSVFPPVSYTLLSFSVAFSDYRYAHISELLKSDFFIFWAYLLLAPWLWLLIALRFMSSFKIWCSFNYFFFKTLQEREFSMLHFRYGITPLYTYSVLETWIIISACPCLIPSSASLSFFSQVLLWVLSQMSIGPEFSNQNVMSAHLVIMLRSPGIKCNAASRAVASTEEKWANTNPAACLFCAEVMLPDGHPEEALWKRWCAGPDRRNKLFLESEKHSDKCSIMEHIFIRAVDGGGQDHKGHVGSHYKY